jgi:hypothetical protein
VAYASSTDVQTIYGKELTPEETLLVGRRLEQVERMIVRRVPDLAGQIAAGDIDQADVIDIESEAVLRVIRNPEGYLSEGDGSYNYMLSHEAGNNTLRILPDEWLLLGIRPSKMFVLVPNLVAPGSGSSFGTGG